MRKLVPSRRRTRWLPALAGLALLVAPTLPVAAQTGTVTGRVTGSDQAGTGLEGARVTVVGSNAAAFTNREGVYFLRNLAPGTIQVRVVRLGYSQAARSVTVAAGQTAELDFVLESAPFTLDEIVTTATGQQRKAEIGNVVNTIQVTQLAEEVPIKSMSDLLQSRAPGVSVIQSAGTTGSGTRIRIRGANSVSLSNEPLYVVDGIRVESGAASTTLGTGGQAPSRINDINPDEIESIEVVKGPSAAALYGTAAANGVVLITTKRGSAGRPRWNAWSEGGVLTDRNDYPDNLRGQDAAGARCRLPEVAAGTCAIAEILRSNPMEDPIESPLGNGLRQQYGLSVSGGSEQAQYFLSAEQEWERGLWTMPEEERARILLESGRPELREEEIHPNSLRKTNVRANVSASVSSNANVQVSTGYVDSRLRLPENDNNILGILSSALTGDGRGQNDPTRVWGFFRPGETFNSLNEQRVQRLTVSAQTTYNPLSWLTARSIVGLDLTSRVDNALQRLGEGPNFSTNRQGFASENRRTIQQYTVDVGATASFQLTDQVTSKTSGGVQWYKDSFRGTNAFGQFLPPGSVTIGSGSVQTAGEVTVESVTFGSFVEQVFGYKDRVFLTGAVRADRNSAVGQNFGTKVYPKGAISYLISDESFFPTGAFLSSLRLRGAIGESGLQPGTTDALAFFTPVTAAAPTGGDEAGVLLGGFGNDELRPETSREIEVGFDATFFDSRLALEATYYHKRSRDALIQVPTPPSAGNPAVRFENIGEVTNEGVELTLNGQLLTSGNVSWDATLTGSFLRNRVTDMGGQPPISLNASFSQQAREGFTLGGYWARPITAWNDANGDGQVAYSELVIGDTLEFVGPALPTRELGFNTAVTLFNNRIRISATADYRGGHFLKNHNEDFRCRSSGNCLGLYEADAPEFERVRAAAITLSAANRTDVGFMESAEFVKLREVSVTFNAPVAWTGSLGLDRASLTLSGRNLATWTDYTGLDPELNGQGQAAANGFAQREFLTQPPASYFSARLNISF